MRVEWFNGSRPETKFAPNFKVPIGIGVDGTQDFVKRMTDYVLRVEKDIIEKEALVSEVPKNGIDPYKHTQQWKQHNILDDVSGLGGEHLTRFPEDPVIEELFNLVRRNYLEHLANLRFPRIKVYIHGWANVLRDGEWISKHTHMSHNQAYLAATYYLTTNDTSLYMDNPLNPGAVESGDIIGISTEARKLVFFPSFLPHWSDATHELRISLAFDIVTEDTMKGNPWRPHRLLDDPNTMPGIDGK